MNIENEKKNSGELLNRGSGEAVETVEYRLASVFGRGAEEKREAQSDEGKRGAKDFGLSDEEIEELLFTDSEPIPESVAKKISPSRKAFLLTVWGLALSALLMPAYRHSFDSVFGSYAFAPITSLRLDILLPALGIILMLIGLSKMKTVNRAFKFSYIAAYIRAVVFILTIVFTFSVLHEGEAGRSRAIILTAASVVSMLTLVFGVYAGFRAVRSSIGFEPRSGEFVVFAIWYLLLTAFAVENSQSIVLLLGMPISFALILLALHLLTQSFDEAGYAVRAERTRFSAVSFSAAGALVLACTFFFTFSCLGKYSMREVPLNAYGNSGSSGSDGASHQIGSTEREAIRQRLVELSVPEYVLNDLRGDELKLFSSALRANSSSEFFSVSPDDSEELHFVIIDPNEWSSAGGEGSVSFELIPGSIPVPNVYGYWRLDPDGSGQTAGMIVSENGELLSVLYDRAGGLRVTTVVVETDADELNAPFKRYSFIHYFEFSPNVSFYGTEALRISPVSQRAAESYMLEEFAGGRILYERDGESYSAEFNSLESPAANRLMQGREWEPAYYTDESGQSFAYNTAAYTAAADNAAHSPDGNIYASFSVPDGAEKVRGYIAYSVREKNTIPQVYANALLTLVHQRTAANVSGKTAYEFIKFNSRESGVFTWITQTLIFDKQNMKL